MPFRVARLRSSIRLPPSEEGASTHARGRHQRCDRAASGTAVDSAGNLYFEQRQHRFQTRYERQPDGVRGELAARISGDGGPAINAQLNLPVGIAVDSKGDVYISDSQNNVVRIVTPDGNINTFAGSGTPGYTTAIPARRRAAARRLNNPLGVAVNKNRQCLYRRQPESCDPHRQPTAISIRSPATQVYWGFVYSRRRRRGEHGAALLSDGRGGRLSGNVYICDRGNYVIRQVVTTGTDAGNIHSYAGTTLPMVFRAMADRRPADCPPVGGALSALRHRAGLVGQPLHYRSTATRIRKVLPAAPAAPVAPFHPSRESASWGSRATAAARASAQMNTRAVSP